MICSAVKLNGEKCGNRKMCTKKGYSGPYCYNHSRCQQEITIRNYRLHPADARSVKIYKRKCRNFEVGGTGYCRMHSQEKTE